MLLIHSFLNVIDALILRKDIKNLEDAYHGLIREAEIIRDDTKASSTSKTRNKQTKAHGKSKDKTDSTSKAD